MKWRAKTGHKRHMNQNDEDGPRISSLRPGLVGCQDGVETEISPILMLGSKTDHVARQCPRNTKWTVVEV